MPPSAVFLIIGTYSDIDVPTRANHPDTCFPLTLSHFHHIPSFTVHPGLVQEVWSGGRPYFVQIYLGPKATPSDRAATRAALNSLRIGPAGKGPYFACPPDGHTKTA